MKRAQSPRSAGSRTRRPSIRRTLLTFTLLLVVIPSLVIAGVVAAATYSSQLQNSRDQLLDVAVQRQAEIDHWVAERKSDLGVIATDTALHEAVEDMLGYAAGSPEYQAAHALLLQRFNSFLRQKSSFVELFLLNVETGRTMVSTDTDQEGASHWGSPYFQDGRYTVYVRPPRYDSAVHATAIVIARPVEEADGNLVAVLVGRINLAELGTRVRGVDGSGGGADIYLVSVDRLYVTGNLPESDVPSGVMSSVGIFRALEGQSGLERYTSFQGVPVFGAYRWAPSLGVVVLAERSQVETVTPALRLTFGIVGVVIVAAALASLAALGLTRRIVGPIVELTEAATQIAAGDVQRVVPVQREDEIGQLAGAFNSMTAQLRSFIATLEQRVAERTADLARRSAQLEAAAHVARDAATVRDVDVFLGTTVNLISQRFGFYHAGIFLPDENGEYFVLRAASSEGGRQMLDRGHRLKAGVGIVGTVGNSGQPRVALDVGEDAVFFQNPSLPLTRSEMALPLQTGERVVGVLDVQSTEPEAFTEEDVAVLQVMADQLTVALENVRLLSETRSSLEELSRVYNVTAGESWRQFVRSRAGLGRLTLGSAQVPAAAWETAFDRARSAGGAVSLTGGNGDAGEPAVTHIIAVPVKVGALSLGVLGFHRPPESGEWRAEELAFAERVAERLAMALENVRLLEATRQRAAREQLVGEIAGRVRASLDPDTILKTTVRELGRALGAQFAMVELASPGRNGGDAPPTPPVDWAGDGAGQAEQEDAADAQSS